MVQGNNQNNSIPKLWPHFLKSFTQLLSKCVYLQILTSAYRSMFLSQLRQFKFQNSLQRDFILIQIFYLCAWTKTIHAYSDFLSSQISWWMWASATLCKLVMPEEDVTLQGSVFLILVITIFISSGLNVWKHTFLLILWRDILHLPMKKDMSNIIICQIYQAIYSYFPTTMIIFPIFQTQMT